MEHVLYESGAGGRATVLSRHPDHDSALAALVGKGPAFWELDADNPGCADAYMADGRLLCVEPAARRGL